MFERYTERARRVLFFARYEASQLGSITIESEHLLLGLIREGKGRTARIFARSHLSLDGMRREIEGRVVFREKVPTSVEIPFSAELRRILQHAAAEADRMRHDYIGTEHLLLGLLCEERAVAASILIEKGMRLQGVRDDVAQLGTDNDAETQGPSAAIDGIVGMPDYLPSDIVHISFSHRGPMSSSGPKRWVMAGADLRSIIARAYRTDPLHVVMPAALESDARYDVALVLPGETSRDTIEKLVCRALERQFGFTVSREPGPGGEMVVVRHDAAGGGGIWGVASEV